MAEEYKYMVAIRCMTYKHAPFVLDTLRGFSLQETSFPCVYIVIDDASTDGEPEILCNWAEENLALDDEAPFVSLPYGKRYVAYHKDRPNSLFVILLLYENHYGKKSKIPYVSEWFDSSKYYAVCEGDDYWTDPKKLQIQVEFLETHPEYLFCCHRYKILEQNSGRFLREYGYDYYQDGSDLIIDEKLFLKVWVTQTLTVMMKIDTWKVVFYESEQYQYDRDVHTYYLLLRRGKGVALNRCMGVYRWHNGGIAIGQTYFQRYETGFNLYNELLIKNPDDELLKPKVLYYGIRLLRVSGYGKGAFSLMKYLLSLTGLPKTRAAIVVSFLIPSKLYILAANAYSKERLNKLGEE